MTIASVVTAIQAVNAGIAGIRSAPTTIPGDLHTAILPCALVFIGPGEPERVSDFSLHFRTFYVRFYVKPVAQGRKPDEGYREAYTLLQTVLETYLSDITLGGAVQHIGRGARYDPPTFEDTGIVEMMYGETAYHGFEIVVTTKEQIT